MTLTLALAMSLGLATPPATTQMVPVPPDFQSWSSELLYLRVARGVCRRKIALKEGWLTSGMDIRWPPALPVSPPLFLLESLAARVRRCVPRQV
jgi:hypothetical protein